MAISIIDGAVGIVETFTLPAVSFYIYPLLLMLLLLVVLLSVGRLPTSYGRPALAVMRCLVDSNRPEEE